MDSPAVTDTPYEPDPELRTYLEEAGQEIHLTDKSVTSFELLGGLDARQEKYNVEYEGFSLSATETQSPVGVFISLDGHLGLAATTHLVSALVHGQITQVYSDEAPPPDGWSERYQDLTAEWYQPKAVDAGLPEKRLSSSRAFEAERLTVEQLEEWADTWLSLD